MPPPTPTHLIFTSLPGKWSLIRHLTSPLPTFPSGTFTGTATFSPRPSPSPHISELLYSETGAFQTSTGLTLPAKRKYIYRYNSEEDRISVWFVKGGEGKEEEVEDLFHDLEIRDEGVALTGRGEHLCERDMYWGYYEFRLRRGEAEEGERGMDVFGVRYKVRGPEKEYESQAGYERVEEGCL